MIAKRNPRRMLLVLFIIVLAIRLYFAFQTPNFTGEESYYHIRQVGTIQAQGLPDIDDPLSYSGRQTVLSPLFHYLLAIFSVIFGQQFALKVLPNIFASLLVYVMFYASYQMTNNKNAAMMAAFASGFIPIFMQTTVNTVSTVSLIVPMMFFMLYCFMRLESKWHLHAYLIMVVLLPLVSPLAFLFLFGMLIYLLLIRLEYQKLNRKEVELILFSTFIIVWIELLIYKNAFLFHNYALIWQNTPVRMLSTYFTETTIIDALYQVGIIPLFFGMYTIYKFIFREKNRQVYLLMGFAISIAMLLWLRLIRPDVGLMFLGVILVLLFSQSFKNMSNYLDITKVDKQKPFIMGGFILVFILTSALPAISLASYSVDHAIDQDTVDALTWLKDNSDDESVVLSTVSEGHLITAIADRKNVADTNFVLIREPNIVLDDIENIYTSIFMTKAMESLDKHDVDYIFFSDESRHEYGIDRIKYVGDDCFKKVYTSESVGDEARKIEIYHVLCSLRGADS